MSIRRNARAYSVQVRRQAEKIVSLEAEIKELKSKYYRFVDANKKVSKGLDDIFSRIKTGTPLTVTNKFRLILWIEELIEELRK